MNTKLALTKLLDLFQSEEESYRLTSMDPQRLTSRIRAVVDEHAKQSQALSELERRLGFEVRPPAESNAPPACNDSADSLAAFVSGIPDIVVLARAGAWSKVGCALRLRVAYYLSKATILLKVREAWAATR